MIELQDVSFSYERDEPVLDKVNVKLPQGLTLLLGPNGCGKSTLLKITSGVEKPDSGCVFVNGLNLWKKEVEARKSLAYLPEQPDLTPYATIKEILYLVCRLRNEPLARADEMLEFFGLKHVASRTVRELSMGQRKRAVFSALLIGEQEHIFLDEPLEGMDRNIQKEILEWVSKRKKDGACIVIVSHTIEPFVEKASKACSIRNGSVFIYNDLPDRLEERISLLEALSKGKSL
jgi:ABC-2 type transport system ATP-binding protein